MVLPDGLRRLELGNPRHAALDVYRHLKRLIVEGDLVPGTELKQAELARLFEVSRTPLREAFRMLQAEGFVESTPNQRGRVRGLSAQEVDELYGSRILLESLGVRVTAGRLTDAEVARAHALIEQLDGAHRRGEMSQWLSDHREFHRVCAARTGQSLQDTVSAFHERSSRYIRSFQRIHPEAFARGHAEHQEILAALEAGDPDRAGHAMAVHLEHSSRAMLGDIDESLEPHAITQALAMAKRRSDDHP